MSGYGTLAILTALLGSVLAILAVAVYEGYLASSLVWNFTSTELGAFAAVAIVVAIVAKAADS